jgi:hypothetical protein
MLGEAARSGELDRPSDEKATPSELIGNDVGKSESISAGNKGILQLILTPETLQKLASSGTNELVISINER